GVDLGNDPVGGGAVSSFAYNSTLQGRDGDTALASQDAPLALSDITGMSSAFFVTALAEDAQVQKLDPEYTSWAFSGDKLPRGAKNVYAAGGAIDNTFVANMLAFTDVK